MRVSAGSVGKAGTEITPSLISIHHIFYMLKITFDLLVHCIKWHDEGNEISCQIRLHSPVLLRSIALIWHVEDTLIVLFWV